VVRKALLAAAVAALLVPAGASAAPREDARAISAGLRRAVATGRLEGVEAQRYRTVVRRARAVLALLPGSRWETLARVLHEVRLQARVLTRPRALSLFSMLEENTDYLSVRKVPPNETDIRGRDGVVYRVGWGYGLQFHPLANAIELNGHVTAGRLDEAARLGAALAARSVRRSLGGAALEYYFPYGGGRPPWTSGMAQAVAAQAFARAGESLGSARLLAAARRAYASIPGRLVRSVSAGPWIRLYSFSDLVVLNAQLQSVLSLGDYARILDVEAARLLEARLRESSRSMLPRFDTGYWSHYSLGRESPLEYHEYVIELLRALGRRNGDSFWTDAGTRFRRYTEEPPIFKGRVGRTPIYPWPADGFRDAARVGFWISKISSVTVEIGGERQLLGLTRGGWHTVVWRPGRRAVGGYAPVVRAVDLAGNGATATLPAVRIAVDRDPPEVKARVIRRTLAWRVVDEATPWVRLRIVLRRGDRDRTLVLGRRPLSGSARLDIPRGRWLGLLVAADSSGNRTRVSLGILPAG
jgi:D-glucuronyl C5-epimerase C-terminus